MRVDLNVGVAEDVSPGGHHLAKLHESRAEANQAVSDESRGFRSRFFSGFRLFHLVFHASRFVGKGMGHFEVVLFHISGWHATPC